MPMPSPAVGGRPHSSARDVVLVDRHRLVLSGRGQTSLVFETSALLDGVVELAEAVREFAPGGVGLEALGEFTVATVTTRER